MNIHWVEVVIVEIFKLVTNNNLCSLLMLLCTTKCIVGNDIKLSKYSKLIIEYSLMKTYKKQTVYRQ